ncbi:AAA family ATPase [Amycolatopsis sp. VC5-11]|uniref:AAA family ATPase n=1 Tax=Amycolatopsis sp. VC5-11 TaxID=3120156 RepID=UPI003009E989
MQINVVDVLPPAHSNTDELYLLKDNWDDWFEFRTQYNLVFSTKGKHVVIGPTKIGRLGQLEESPPIPESFEQLDESFFSIGQDPSFYEKLNSMGAAMRRQILVHLRDFAYDLSIYDRVKFERVTERSLMRSLTELTVREQFNRMAQGGARLTEFNFRYRVSASYAGGVPDFHEIPFDVTPYSRPPSNIHVLVGRNGAGKTTLLANMAIDLLSANDTRTNSGKFLNDSPRSQIFANLVSVSFSAFDPFRTPSDNLEIKYSYVGLHRRTSEPGTHGNLKDFQRLAGEFTESVANCLQTPDKIERWKRALIALESDPNFAELGLSGLVSGSGPINELPRVAGRQYEELSSGHKIVLLTMTRLVESVEEKTLVLIDEPESHLHPPLLSAFVRALSDLLADRNGVAIIATHSPVVLQEVPRRCVWKIRRSGRQSVIERPTLETFGENVGTLTREVFGLEVSKSGFHRIIADAVDQGMSFERIEEYFEGSLGGEARILARSLIAIRDQSPWGSE